MRACIAVIADTDALAGALNRAICAHFGESAEVYFMTYRRMVLSQVLARRADLLVLGLLRRDDVGHRAEGLYAAEKWLAAGKRTLVISSACLAENVDSALYWDLGSGDTLGTRIEGLLRVPVPTPSQLAPLWTVFNDYCRPPVDRHHEF